MAMMVRLFERPQEGTASECAPWGWEIWEGNELCTRGEAPNYPEAAVTAWNFVEAARAYPARASIKAGPPSSNGRDPH